MPAPRRTARMSDTRLFSLAKKQKQAKIAEKDAESEAERLSGLIIPELEARGTKAIEGGGVRINKVAGTYTAYDLEVMEQVLSPRLFKQVTKTVVDTDAMTAAINAGKIKPRVLARFAKTIDKKAYILVSYVAGE